MTTKRSVGFQVLFWATRAILTLVVLAVGFGVFAVLESTKPEGPEPDVVSESVRVRAFEAMPVSIAREWSGYGTARAMNSVTISAEVAAVVRERPPSIEAGQPVAKGEILLRLDDTDFGQRAESIRRRIESVAAQLSQLDVEASRLADRVELTEGQVAVAQRDYDRAVEVTDGGAGTESQVDARLSQLQRARQELSTVREQLDRVPARRAQLEAESAALSADLAIALEDIRRTEVVSPFEGTIQSVFVEQGERVNVGEAIVRVVDLSRVEIPLRLPVSAAPTISVGDPVSIATDGPEPATWSGTIARIAPETDPATRTFTAFIEVRQRLGVGETLLLPGQFVVARVVSDDVRRRIVVPRRVIDADRLFVADDSSGNGLSVKPRTVEVAFYADRSFPDFDAAETQWAVLAGGVAPGELVIVGSAGELQPGMPVELIGSGEPRASVAEAQAPTGEGGGS